MRQTSCWSCCQPITPALFCLTTPCLPPHSLMAANTHTKKKSSILYAEFEKKKKGMEQKRKYGNMENRILSIPLLEKASQRFQCCWLGWWFNTLSFTFCCDWFFFFQALQEEISVSGSKIKLSYLSSRTPGYKSVLRISLTHPTIPFNLMKVHLMVAVEGRLFRKWFSAAPDLSYYFIWDKTDVYSQKVYGLSEAFGKMLCPWFSSYGSRIHRCVMSHFLEVRETDRED